MIISGAILSLLLVSWLPTPVTAQSQEDIATSLIDEYMTQAGVPGVAVAIAIRGELVYSNVRGVADLEMAVPVTEETLFRTASTLKPMTAVAIMTLALAGTLDLDAPVQTYCPAYPTKRWPVTARHLLEHEAGVRPSVFADVFNPQHYASTTDALARFEADSLVAEPGTTSVYSNAGYTLLACAIEGASGSTYDDYVRAHVLTPAGMTATRPDNVFEIIPGRARGYMVRTEKNTELWKGLWQPRHLRSTAVGVPFNADPVDPSWSPGAGGYLTTPVDLVRFASALMAGRLLPSDYVARMQVPHLLATARRPAAVTDGCSASQTRPSFCRSWVATGMGLPVCGCRRLANSRSQ